jgi:hypothetical protein
MVKQTAEQNGIAINLEKIEDMPRIIGYGIMSTPGLVIDGKLVKVGGNPDDPNNPFQADDFIRRRGPGRRLSDRVKAAEEGELTKEQFLFLMAIDSFKKANSVAFPSWTDVLEVIRLLGYRKTMSMELTLTSAEDWREAANAPSSVRSPRWDRHVKKDTRDAA